MALSSSNAEAIDKVSDVYNAPNFDAASAAYLSGPTGSTTTTVRATDPTAEYYKKLYDDAQAQQRQTATAFLQDILTQYGLGSLAGSVDSIVREGGYNAATIQNNIRQTSAYKDRFKGLLALQSKGVTDIKNEGEYINLENQYRQVFRDAGIQSYIGDAGSATERENIAKLVGDYSVSVNEVRARVADAQRVVMDQTPAEVRDSLQRYYNISPADLVAYSLDPTRNGERINQIANAAMVGGYAKGYGLDANVDTAERIAQMSAGNQDLNASALADRFTQAADVYRQTDRLANIEQGELSTEEALQNEFKLGGEAAAKIKGLQSRERARFSGTSGFSTGSLSRSSGV